MLEFIGHRRSHSGRDCNPPYPAPHNALNYGPRTPPGHHSYLDLLTTRWSQAQAFWPIAPGGGLVFTVLNLLPDPLLQRRYV